MSSPPVRASSRQHESSGSLRSLVATLLLPMIVLVTCNNISAQSNELAVLPDEIEGVAVGQMMNVYLMGRVRLADDERLRRYEAIQLPEQVADYQRQTREFFLKQLGTMPEHTPLNARVLDTQDHQGYRVERIIFESQPGHYVTSLLYLPASPPPYPGVLVPCGHSTDGKAYSEYQRACILLALNGLAAFCFDPIDQGERVQLFNEQGRPVATGTSAHVLIGVGSILVGRNAATFFVWDGMRAIDYLQSRPDIDGQRIGCTGNSGGGTQTSYLLALDDRIRCAAPCCYLTGYRKMLETIGPQDAEQLIHGQVGYGMDHADYLMMRAPVPALIGAATQDFFDINATWDTFRQAKRLYARLGFAERVDLIENDDKHGFSRPLRVAAVRWMRRWLLGKDDAITEPEIKPTSEEDTWCTPDGKVMALDGARTTYDLNIELEERLAEQRQQRWSQPDKIACLDEVRKITGIRKLTDLPEASVEHVGSLQRNGYHIDKLILTPEPGVWLPLLAFVPENPTGSACLYLHEDGKQMDAGVGGPIETHVLRGQVVVAADLRGMNETQARNHPKYQPFLGPEWQDIGLAYLLGRSYVAMRAEDVLVCARFARGYGTGSQPQPLHLVSVGLTGVPALHAAALEPGLFERVTFHRCLRSWADVLRAPLARNQYVNVVHGGLAIYDLPDLLSLLPRNTTTVNEPLVKLE